MPVMRKYGPDEVRDLERERPTSRRQLIEAEYDGYLAQFEPNEWGEAELNEEEDKATIRRRLKAAAQRRGLGMEFHRTRNNTVMFKVIGGDQLNLFEQEVEAAA